MKDLMNLKGKDFRTAWSHERMATYLLRGYNIKSAYEMALAGTKKSHPIDFLSQEAFKQLKKVESETHDVGSLVKIGRAYGKLGEKEEAGDIGIRLLSIGEFECASAVFESAGISKKAVKEYFDRRISETYVREDPEKVAEYMRIQNFYLESLANEMMERRDRNLKERLENARKEYREKDWKPIKTKVKRLKYRKKVKELEGDMNKLGNFDIYHTFEISNLEKKKYGLEEEEKFLRDLEKLKKHKKNLDRNLSRVEEISKMIERAKF